MKLKVSLLVCTASLFVAFPVLGQGQGAGHGNASDHSGHNADGKSAGHRQDAPHGFDLVLTNPSATAAVAIAMTSVTSTLKSGSLKTPAGAVIPASAQSRTYALLTADATQSDSPAEISAALSTAGAKASAIVPSLMRSFSLLGSSPAELPSVIASYNEFTRAASNGFISNPPPEFLALRAVLAQLTAAANAAK